MTKNGLVLIPLLIGLGALTACGGDDDDSPAPTGGTAGVGGGVTGTGGLTGSGGAGTTGGATGSGGATGGDPFAGYNCTATDICTQTVCAAKQSYDLLVSTCASNPTPQCDTYRDCVATYVQCMGSACPGGQLDSAAATTCGSNYATCIGGA